MPGRFKEFQGPASAGSKRVCSTKSWQRSFSFATKNGNVMKYQVCQSSLAQLRQVLSSILFWCLVLSLEIWPALANPRCFSHQHKPRKPACASGPAWHGGFFEKQSEEMKDVLNAINDEESL